MIVDPHREAAFYQPGRQFGLYVGEANDQGLSF